MKRNLKQQDLNGWLIRPKEVEAVVEILPKEPISVEHGDTVTIKAHLRSKWDGPLTVNWQKLDNGMPRNLNLETANYYGSSCETTHLRLKINTVDHSDSGNYKIEIKSRTDTITSQEIQVNLKEDSSSKEELNFLRLYSLCQQIGTKAVRMLFDRYIAPQHLSTHLKKCKTDLSRQRPRCSSDQWKTLFPDRSVHDVSSGDFDMTLLTLLIRSTVRILPSTQRWGNKPMEGHIRESDDLERIIQARNFIVHNSEYQLTDKLFQSKWLVLSKAISRLSEGILVKEMDELLTKKFDKYQRNDILNSIEPIKESLWQHTDDIRQLQSRVKEIGEVPHIPTNIRDSQKQQLASWKNDNLVFYSETSVCKAGWDMVRSKRITAFIGRPGSGKTATSRHLALKLKNDEGYEIVPVEKPEQILEYVNLKQRQVFLLDDALGKLFLDMTLYNNIDGQKGGILGGLGAYSKILVTCRTTVYKKAKRLSSYILENVINFQSEEHVFSEKEKWQILQLHCKNENIRDDFEKISLKSAGLMFPLLCKLFATDGTNRKLGERFFNQPNKTLFDEIDDLQVASKIHYAALILCLFNDCTVSTDISPQEEVKMEVYNRCGLDGGTSDKEIIDGLDDLTGTYLRRTENTYTFLHHSIIDVVAYHYGKKYPNQILKYMPNSYIEHKVTVCPQSENIHDLVIVLGVDKYPLLAERLCKDMESLALHKVFMNSALKHPPFLDIFIKVLSSKNYKHIHEHGCFNMSVLLKAATDGQIDIKDTMKTYEESN